MPSLWSVTFILKICMWLLYPQPGNCDNMPIEMAINAKGSFVWDRFSTVVVTCLLDPVRRISVFLFSNCETCSLQNLPEQLTVIHLSRRIQHELTPHSSRGHNVIPC